MSWYRLFYNIDDGELERASSFKKEQEEMARGAELISTRLRRMSCFVILGIIFNITRVGTFFDLITYITNWALLATFFTASLGMYLCMKPEMTPKSHPGLYAAHHGFYSLMLFLQPLVVIMYWGVVHDDHVIEI